MKNMFKCVVVFAVMFMMGVGIVRAATELDAGLEKMVNDKTALRLCMYKNPTNGDIEGGVYYILQANNNTVGAGPWAVLYKRYNSLSYVEAAAGNTNYSLGSFIHVFNSGGRISYNTYKQRLTADKENGFVCPKNFFIDYDWNNELCFSEYESCSDHFKEGPYPVDIQYDTIYKKVDDRFNSLLTDSSVVKDFLDSRDLMTNLRDKVRNLIVNEYSFGSNAKMPAFLDNYIKNFAFDEDSQEFKSAIEAIKKESEKQVDEQVKKGEISQEEGQKKKEEIQNKEASDIVSTRAPLYTDVNLNISSGNDCDSILGESFSKAIKNLFRFVQYLGPIFVIVFSAIDFVKAAISGDDGQMKKASSRLGKRIACGILLFFVPLICGFLLDLGGVTMPDICIRQKG